LQKLLAHLPRRVGHDPTRFILLTAADCRSGEPVVAQAAALQSRI